MDLGDRRRPVVGRQARHRLDARFDGRRCSMPSPFVFRIAADDPHPAPWIRVRLSCALGEALYPHPQWREISELWAALYPPGELDPCGNKGSAALDQTIQRSSSCSCVTGHDHCAVRHSREIMPLDDRQPARLVAHFRALPGRHEGLRDAARPWRSRCSGRRGRSACSTPRRRAARSATYSPTGRFAARSTSQRSAPHPSRRTRGAKQRLLWTQPV